MIINKLRYVKLPAFKSLSWIASGNRVISRKVVKASKKLGGSKKKFLYIFGAKNALNLMLN